MRKAIIFLTVISLGLASCSPIYKCGEEKPAKLKLSKRVQSVVTERDELCSTLSDRDSQITGLKSDIADLNKQVDELEKQNNNLIDDNLSRTERFNTAMQQKSEELTAKEKLLLDREKALMELRKRIARQDSITKQLNDILRNALLGFNSDELSVEIKNGKVYVSMSDKLLFKSGSAAVESKGKDAIKALADVLNKNPDVDILVEGHTDNVPIKTAIYRDNWDLSVARAISIVRMITEEHKISATRLTASGKGEFAPRATNETTEGRAKNRRTEIILSPKLDEIMKLLDNK